MKPPMSLRTLAILSALALAGPATSQAEAPQKQAAATPGVMQREAVWYSEQVRVVGRLFKPAGATGDLPAAILAPGWGRTADTLDVYAAQLAASGIVALTIDYRGWGRSGGFVYLGERFDSYDRQRFTDATPELVIRRGRLDPDAQVQDIRNAITYLQSRPDVDPNRIGVMGVDMAGGHVVSVMGMDARAKAGVALTPIIPGAGETPQSFVPDSVTQQQMIRLARDGAPPRNAGEAKARNALEASLALAEYKPFWRLSAIPADHPIDFIAAGTDDKVDNAANAVAAYRAMRANGMIETIEGARHALKPDQAAEAARMAAAFFKSKL